jgi:hypothetical protein
MSMTEVTTPGTAPGTAPMTTPETTGMTGFLLPPMTRIGGTEDTPEWITVTTVMTRRGVSRRTVRRWVAAGLVESRLVQEDGRQVRLIRGDTLPAAGIGDDTVTITSDVRDDGTEDAHGDDTRPRHGDAGFYDTVTRQAEEIAYLRAQLDVRAEELRRRDQAEAELRRLLLTSQQALQTVLERPMLPAAPDPQPPAPKRARWWSPWRKG